MVCHDVALQPLQVVRVDRAGGQVVRREEEREIQSECDTLNVGIVKNRLVCSASRVSISQHEAARVLPRMNLVTWSYPANPNGPGGLEGCYIAAHLHACFAHATPFSGYADLVSISIHISLHRKDDGDGVGRR